MFDLATKPTARLTADPISHPLTIRPRPETPDAISLEIDSGEIKRIYRDTNLPTNATGTIRLVITSDNKLFASQTTANGAQSVSTEVKLGKPIAGRTPQGVSIDITTRVFRILGESSDQTIISFDPSNPEVVTCRTDGTRLQLEALVQSIDIEEEPPSFIGMASADHLKKGIAFVSYQKPAKTDRLIYNGFVLKSGTFSGVVEGILNSYTSPDIDPALSFVQPKVQAANLVAVLAKMMGHVALYSTDRSLYLRANNVEMRSDHGGTWPQQELRVNAHPSRASLIVDQQQLYRELLILSIFAKTGYFTLTTSENIARLHIRGLNAECKSEANIKVGANAELETNVDEFALNVPILRRLFETIDADRITMEIGSHFVRIKTNGEGYDTTSVAPMVE